MGTLITASASPVWLTFWDHNRDIIVDIITLLAHDGNPKRQQHMVCNVCRNWGNRRPSCFKVFKPSEGSKVQREKFGEHLNFCLIPLLFHWPHLSPLFPLVPPLPPGDRLLFLTQYPYYWLFNPLLAPPSQGSYIMRTHPNREHLIASLHFAQSLFWQRMEFICLL